MTTEGLSTTQFRAQLQEQHQEVEASGAPAAAASTPAAKETPHNAAIAPQERLTEDDQIIEDLRREHFAKKNQDEAEADDAEQAPKPAKAPKSKDKEKTPPKAKDAPAPAKETAAVVKYATPEAAVAAIVKVLESGDPRALAKAVGKPENFLDVTTQKWAAFREQQNSVREREKTVAQREHAYAQNYAQAKKELGPALLAAKAYQDGDYSQFITLVQELTGETYDEAQRKVIKGELAVDPEIKKLRAELRQARLDMRKEKDVEKEQSSKKTQEQNYAAAVDAVSQELSGHRIAKVKGFQRAVLDKVRESFDPREQAYTMSFEEAADAIMEDKDAEAEALGYSRHSEPAPRQLPAAREAVVPPRSRAAEARAPDGEPWMERELSDEEIIASIKRDVRSGKIKV